MPTKNALRRTEAKPADFKEPSMTITHLFRRIRGCSTRLTLALCLALLCLPWGTARAEEMRAIQPFDLSSPRSTLTGFIEVMDSRYAAYWGPEGVFQSYLRSGNRFMPLNSLESVGASSAQFPALWSVLDSGKLPQALTGESEWRLALLLKEVLDRIDLPPKELIPDAQAVSAQGLKRWTLPGTNLQLTLVESGPRSGQWLFSSETVAHLSDFYQEVKDLPYKSVGSPNWYTLTIRQPIGLAVLLQNILPPRVFLTLPAWLLADFLNQPLWRWLGIIWVFFLIGLVYRAAWLFQHPKNALNTPPSRTGHGWRQMLPSLWLVLSLPLGFWFLVDILRIADPLYGVISIGIWSLFYLALTRLIWRSLKLLADRLDPPAGQLGPVGHPLERMLLQLLSFVLCAGVLIEGTSRLGVPAYSLLAGLGLGGLAVALAGQQALSNLFASLIIMMEKPFEMGHIIRAGQIEGIVEEVGFRSTRIRSIDRTVQTVPSSTLINQSVENLSLRAFWRVPLNIHLDQDTPIQRIESLIERTKQFIADHPLTKPDRTQVLIAELATDGIRLLVVYFIKVHDPMAELEERHRMLHGILEIAQSLEIKLARDT